MVDMVLKLSGEGRTLAVLRDMLSNASWGKVSLSVELLRDQEEVPSQLLMKSSLPCLMGFGCFVISVCL